jgi:hypothetical protein
VGNATTVSSILHVSSGFFDISKYISKIENKI